MNLIEKKWDKIRKRDWAEVRDAWIDHVPTFSSVGATPDPGLERLATLSTTTIPELRDPPIRLTDIEGIRRNALWEAVFLFHKCSHTNLAAQRLGEKGMHSWCMFNAYHSAFLGARGIMALLGVALAKLDGKQVALDLFPEPERHAKKTPAPSRRFQDFLLIRLPDTLDQRYWWFGFQRMLRISEVKCWDVRLDKELVNVSWANITPPRNHFLYQAHYWPLQDLVTDGAVEEMRTLIGDELDTNDQGFLLRLSFLVYRLFEQLMIDLGELSPVIREQLNGSRTQVNLAQPEFDGYKLFLSQVGATPSQAA